jgi:hypothetical protein
MDIDPGEASPETLSNVSRLHLLARLLRRRVLTQPERRALAAQWRQLREERSMLRVWSSGCLKIGRGQKLLLPETQSLAAAVPLT